MEEPDLEELVRIESGLDSIAERLDSYKVAQPAGLISRSLGSLETSVLEDLSLRYGKLELEVDSLGSIYERLKDLDQDEDLSSRASRLEREVEGFLQGAGLNDIEEIRSLIDSGQEFKSRKKIYAKLRKLEEVVLGLEASREKVETLFESVDKLYERVKSDQDLEDEDLENLAYYRKLYEDFTQEEQEYLDILGRLEAIDREISDIKNEEMKDSYEKIVEFIAEADRLLEDYSIRDMNRMVKYRDTCQYFQEVCQDESINIGLEKRYQELDQALEGLGDRDQFIEAIVAGVEELDNGFDLEEVDEIKDLFEDYRSLDKDEKSRVYNLEKLEILAHLAENYSEEVLDNSYGLDSNIRAIRNAFLSGYGHAALRVEARDRDALRLEVQKLYNEFNKYYSYLLYDVSSFDFYSFKNRDLAIVDFGLKEDYLDKRQEVEARADEIIGELDLVGEPRERQLLKLHDYIIQEAEYNTKDISYMSADDYSAYGVLINKVGVCSSYSKAMQLLASKLDIDCLYVSGYSSNNQGRRQSHAWNKVLIDGDWYNMDLTWDDPVTNEEVKSIPIRYDYFLKADREMYRHIENVNINFPEAKGARDFMEELGVNYRDSQGHIFRKIYSGEELGQELLGLRENVRNTKYIQLMGELSNLTSTDLDPLIKASLKGCAGSYTIASYGDGLFELDSVIFKFNNN